MRIFVANLPYHLSESGLKKLFRIFGAVINARIIRAQETGQSKGFGFVTMEDREAARLAIQQLNGRVIRDREIEVKPAEEYPVRKFPKP